MEFQISYLPNLFAKREVLGRDVRVDLIQVAKLLKAIQVESSLSACARTFEVSYKTLWDLVRDAESVLGFALLKKIKGRGSALTPEAEQLLHVLDGIDTQASLLKKDFENKTLQFIQGISSTHVKALKPRIFMSNDPLLEDFLSTYQGLEFQAMESSKVIESLMNRDCDIAGFYITDEESIQQVRTRLLKSDLIAIPVMSRTQGIILAKGNPWRIQKLQDLARPEIRFINRQKGVGTRQYVEQLLQKTGLDSNRIHGLSEEEFTQMAAAYAVISGVADAGMGLEYIAQASGLDFLKLSEEIYFLAMDVSMSKRHVTKDFIKQLRARADLTVGYRSLKLRNSKTK